MCSPSRATLLTGRYPAQHGVTLTHTQADLRPNLGNSPAVLRELAGMMRGPNAPRRRALRNFGRGLVQTGPRSGDEPELSSGTQNLAHVLRNSGYEVAYKGKWHLTHPSGGELLGGWAPSDTDRRGLQRMFLAQVGAGVASLSALSVLAMWLPQVLLSPCAS